MKIRVESKYGNYEINEPGDDKDIYDMMEMWQRLLIALSFHPNAVRAGFEAIVEEYEESK